MQISLQIQRRCWIRYEHLPHFLILKCKQLAAVVLNEFIDGRLPCTLGTYFIK